MAIRNDIHSEKHYYNDADGDKHPTSLWTSTRTVEVDSDNLVNNETTLADATSWDNTYDAAATQPSGLTSLISKCTTFFKNVKFLKNKTDELTTTDTGLQRDIDTVTNAVDGKVSKSGDTMTGELVVAKDSGSATVRVKSGDKACVLYAQSDMRGLSTGGNTILGVDNDIKMYIVGNDYSISNPAKFRTALSLDNYYQAKGSYLTTSAASSTYLTKTDASSTYLKKTDAANTYIKDSVAEARYVRKNTLQYWSSVMYTNHPTNADMPITLSCLTYWDGAYDSSHHSNLKYCNKGAFGDVCVKSVVGVGETKATGILGHVPFIGGDSTMEIGQYLDFHKAGTTADYSTRVYANDAGGLTCGSGTFVNGSSRKIKKNIEPITQEEADKVLNLQAVKFDYTHMETNNQDERGFIAEDVAEILPNLVVPESYTGDIFNPAGLKYENIIPYLVMVCQRQQKEIDELRGMINETK